MGFRGALVVTKTSATTATCLCPCGHQFTVDAVVEQFLFFDKTYNRLRAICAMCGRVEPVFSYDEYGGTSPAPNRISDFF